MNYEVVELKEKKVVGLTARTGNNDVNMTQVIGTLWQRFYGDGIYHAIAGKKNNCAIGLYSNYKDGVNDRYDVTVCCEVNDVQELKDGMVAQTINPGKYAKFVVHGNMQTAVMDFWTKLWVMDINRSFDCDFEEYQGDGDMENSEIHMYISIA
ncbi:GyrI-like domain-containing protein [Acetobacterium bakii]|uniref:Transcriptional regulator n=1 Tax=Acetobacterium bakii TaxID=52689 RepID=A0A0L6U256_9FIRM|nr:GyrI-like domain-containing protein [Acetobacterium bakii]KNZ42609.1 transcriptional regulator [Acetobacterium bakii]